MRDGPGYRRHEHGRIKEILLQQAIYCGIPAANHAFAEVAAILAERSPNV